MASFIQLLQKITAPKILLWLSTRPPGDRDDYSNPPNSVFGPFPQLVNRKMAAELAARADGYVESISGAGLPQRLWHADESIDGAVARGGVLENHYYPSPQMHEAAADALEAPCRRYLGRYGTAPAARFVVVATARTGTNLLLGMLNDHPGCYGGGELFNVDALAGETIPWREMEAADRPALLALRRRDPVAFWREISGMAAARGFSRIGFKLLYSQGFSHRALLDHLAAEKKLPVIHLKRRNLLRRLVSERQAYATGKWAATPAQGPAAARPAVRLDMAEMIASIRTTEEHQEIYDNLFAGHPVLNLVYEDLAARPQHVAARAAAFLGLAAPATPPAPRFAKTGHEALATALTDYEAIRAKFRRWGGFFDT
jgi:LPS sulfotransferase NodH